LELQIQKVNGYEVIFKNHQIASVLVAKGSRLSNRSS
jgi:hypothetical protein